MQGTGIDDCRLQMMIEEIYNLPFFDFPLRELRNEAEEGRIET